MAEILHQAFEIHGDESLVLDDQYVGGDLGGHFAPGRIGKLAGLGDIGAENEGHLFLREAFERQQQETPGAA